MNEGWICPRCKKVNAPDVKSCDCENDNKVFDKIKELAEKINMDEVKKAFEEHEKYRYVPQPYYPYWFEWKPDSTYRPPWYEPFRVTYYTSNDITSGNVGS